MMHQYFQDLEAGLAARIAENPDGTNARKKYAREVARIGTRLYSGREKIAWCGVTAPFDLLHAMGVTSCFVEFVGAMLAGIGAAGKFIEAAEQEGYAVDSCAYHRSVTGAMLQGVMPRPDFIIATSSPCTAGLGVMENMARTFKKELFVLNVPQRLHKESIAYLVRQLEEMIAFVSDHTGRALDPEALRQAVVNTNQAREWMLETYALASQTPSPANGRLLRDFGTVAALFLGSDTGLAVFQAFRDELRQIAANGDQPPEKKRIMWIQNRIQFKNPVEKFLEEEMGVKIVVDEMNNIPWEAIDPDEPLPGLAKRIISIPFSMDVPARVAQIQKLAREYRIDGAVNPCHWGCRQGTGTRGLISQGLKEIDVPVLNLEIDCVDQRNFAEGQVRTRLEAFVELLESKPSPWN